MLGGVNRFHNYTRNPKRNFSVEAVYSAEHMVYPDENGNICTTKNFQDGETALNCSGGFGSSTMITGSFGFLAASRAIDKYLAKLARLESGATDQ
jgi:tRNA A37 threonylcarbamoyladenosine dehydratase